MSARSAIVAASLKRSLPLLVVVLGLAVMASPALAEVTHAFKSQVGAGELVAPGGVAVGPNGDLYVADTGTGSVLRYDTAGAPAAFAGTGTNSLGTFALPVEGTQVAVDDAGDANAGHIYVADGKSIRAFKATGEAASFSAAAPYITGDQITGYPNRETGSPDEGFTNVVGVAVDASGNIYVSDEVVVHVFAPSGEFLTSFFNYKSNTLAVDSTGFIYAGNEYTFQGFSPAEPVKAGTSYEHHEIPIGVATGLATDTSNDQFYAAVRSQDGTTAAITQYESFAAGNGLVVEFGAEQVAGTTVLGLAVDRSGGANDGDVYASSGAVVDRFGPLVSVPTAVTAPASNVDSAADTATLNGTVNPSGLETTGCEFEYGLTTTYGQTVACAEEANEIGEGVEPVEVHADVSGLEPGNYHFRLVAKNANGTSRGADRTFSVLGAPLIESESAEAAHTEAELMATINPGNAVVTYRFEYGTTAAYGSTTEPATLPAGIAPAQAALGIVGLQPGTTYHFRVIASNAFETAVGPDATFATELGSAAGTCPNEVFRSGFSALLPECRAYEMVSPVDKNGGAVYGKYNTQSTIAGNAIEFLSTTAFAGAPASNVNPYIATRGESGWETEPIGVAQSNPAEFFEFTSPATSADLSKSLTTSREALTPGAIAGGSNLYLRDNTTGALSLIASEPGLRLFDEFNGLSLSNSFGGGTANFSRLFFTSTRVLNNTENAVLGAENRYEYANGALHIPTVPGPSGPVPSSSAILSTDGHRLFLSSPAGVWFVSTDGGTPAPITVSHLAATEGQPVAVTNFQVSADGSTAYFSSTEPLLEEGGTPVAEGGLYRLDVSTGTLTDLTPTEEPRELSIIQVSANGASLFLQSKSQLSPDSTEPSAQGINLFAWNGGEFKLIAQTEPEAFSIPVVVHEESEISPNGQTIAFTSEEPFPFTATTNPRCATTGYCREVYVFSVASGHLSCVSCTAAPSRGPASLTLGRPIISGHEPRSVLDNGDVFFNTPNSLVSRDTNGVGDIYMYRDGRESLISTGTSPDESTFAEATPTGSDVFFRTTQPLVGIDVDSAADLYDARVEGGIAAQNPGGAPPPCEGSGCRGPASSPPPPLSSSVHVGKCEAFGGRARKARAEAKRLAKKAAAASGKRAKALRHHAAKERKQSKQLNRKANQCRRQGK